MPDAYQPDWDIYTCHIEDKPAIMGLDLDLRRFAPLSKAVCHLHISVFKKSACGRFSARG